MEQLGQQFVQSFILPHIFGKILPQVENDTKLQNIWRNDVVSTPEEIVALETTLFVNTGTIFEQDPEMAKLFIEGNKEKGIIGFIDFIQMQSNIAGDNNARLANRTLPGPNGVLSAEAQQQWFLFGNWMINGIQRLKADELVKKAEAEGKLKKEEAEKKRTQIEEGKFVVVNDKNKKPKLLLEEELRKKKEFWEDVFALETDRGKEAISMNPLEVPEEGKAEKGSISLELQEQMWINSSIKLEQKLMTEGFIVKGSFSVDQNGVAFGFVEDKRGARLRVEYGIHQPGKLVRFTFTDKTKRSFSMPEGQLNKYFGKGQSAQEAYLIKQDDERRKSDLPINQFKELLKRAKPPLMAGVPASVTQPGQGEPPSTTSVKRRGEGQKSAGQYSRFTGVEDTTTNSGSKRRGPTPIEAKNNFDQTYNKQQPKAKENKEQEVAGKRPASKNSSKGKGSSNQNKSAVMQALKINAIAGGTGALGGGIFAIINSGLT